MQRVATPTLAPPAQLAFLTPFREFSAPLQTEYEEEASYEIGYDVWSLKTGFKFYIDERDDNRWAFVPANYLTDGASVPRPFWWLLPPWGIYGQAAVLHDHLCETLTILESGVVCTITRARADSIFKQAMKVAGVPAWKRNLMYIAVRVEAKFKRVTGPSIEPRKAAYLAQHQ